MDHKRLVVLATAIQSGRPDWSHAGIVAQLKILNDSWTGNEAELQAHAMAVAANGQALTPGAFNVTPPTPQPIPRPVSRGAKCHICGGTQDQCARRRAFEVLHGISDPHEFETAEEAERKSSGRQLRVRDLPRTTLVDRWPWLPDDLLTEAAESQDDPPRSVDATIVGTPGQGFGQVMPGGWAA
jgi:hypothetical protein